MLFIPEQNRYDSGIPDHSESKHRVKINTDALQAEQSQPGRYRPSRLPREKERQRDKKRAKERERESCACTAAKEI